MDKINKIRAKIDKIDEKIVKLLKKRAKKALGISKLKKTKKIPIKNKKREDEILSKLDTNYEKEIFKKIIEKSREIEENGFDLIS